MGVVADIGRSFRNGPRVVMREHMARGQQETRAFAFLMIGCVLVFVAQWPRLVRVSREEGREMAQLLAYEMLAWLIIWPLIFYALAGLAHVISRLAGGQGTAYGARLALFWSWLAAVPLGLLYGVAAALAGPSLLANLVGAAWIAAFLLFWILCQREAGAVEHRSHAA
ncbi:hypothetical protein [Rubellimicrobium sp. CFH 75288]|uniref:hypothetical protein n=1 Tax=Rubellimicrobium sp. CFH 75288 TaxID=2697034 RepID=UPI001412C8F5|nr:hypothetical protein [Rubellimicrobium sp. CFH 75288]NAZ36835.1 hypothetical protein [Rubellimicrobium sp. CFH 75288]